MSLQQFLGDTFEERKGGGDDAFTLVKGKSFLKIRLGAAGSDGAPLTHAWIKGACLVGVRGSVTMQRDADVAGAGSGFVSAAAAGGGGHAHLFLAAEGRHVILVRLGGGAGGRHVGALVVNTAALLAVEPSVSHSVQRVQVRGISSIPPVHAAFLQGAGLVALLGHGTPLTVSVDPGLPALCTNPQSTLAWSSNLLIPFLAPLDHDSPDKEPNSTFQLNFTRTTDNARGYVILQPIEETSRNIVPGIVKGIKLSGYLGFRILRSVATQGIL